MQRESGTNGARGAALALALLAHALIIWTLLHAFAPLPQPHTALEERITLLYLPPPEQAAPQAAPASGTLAAAHRRSRIRSLEAPEPSTGAAPAAAAPQPAPLPPIDWMAEQQHVAESTGSNLWKQLSQHCHDAEAQHIYPPECHRYVAPEPWEPVQKHFGLAGPLPYVRAGNCVLGLGFFGCAVGKPPPSNGHGFDGMRDPDRPGSVPDNGSYQAPPEAREPLH
jgi:hypothetical protein